MLVDPAFNSDTVSHLKSPYPGLRPFAGTEQRLFFGRTYQVNEILQRLERTSFAVVTGGSGSGKSSIVNAGVIPALRKKQLASRGDFWLAATFSPKDRPFRNLAAELARLIEPLPDQSLPDQSLPDQSDGQPVPDEPELDESARDKLVQDKLTLDVEQALLETNSLAGFFERFESRIKLDEGQAPESRTSANLLIFCDQFEEIFRDQNRDNPEAAQLVDLIVEAYANQSRYPRLFLIIGMRSEDLHRCAAFIDLPNVINGSVFLTRRLDEAEIVSAIVEPMRLSLRLRGIVPERYNQVESDPWPFDADVLHRLNQATAAMASDPDHLPLLQHLLSVLWKFLEKKKLPAALNGASEESRKLGISSEDLAHALGFASAAAMDEFYRTNQAEHPEQKWTESWILKRALDLAAEGVKPSDKRLQVITGRMFRLLAEVDDRGNYKRRWTSRREIIEVCKDEQATPEEVDGIIAAFSSPYPFLNARPGLDGKIDVSHESFIRSWTQFTAWLSDERRLAVAYDMLRRKYLARQRVLAERAKWPFARFWFRPSYDISLDELLQLRVWRKRRSKNTAWATRYVNGLEGEDPESERRSVDDNQAETFNRRLLGFYYRGRVFSQKIFVLTTLAVIGLIAVTLELQLQGVGHKRETRSMSVAYASDEIRQFGDQRSGTFARETNKKLSELTHARAIILAARELKSEWVGPIVDWYRAATFRPNDPGAFYYAAHSSVDAATRKLLDGAMFPVQSSGESNTKLPAARLKSKCEEQLEKPRALGTVLAKDDEFSFSQAKLALAPLEPTGGKQIAILPTIQGSLVLLVLSNDDACTFQYLQSLSLPPGELEIDDSLHLIVVKATGNRPGEPKTWIYRIWWSRPCPAQQDAKSTAGGNCATPFTAEITGPTLAEDHFSIVDKNRLEAEGGGRKRFELRSDHRPTLVNSSDDLNPFTNRRPDERKPRHCATSGRYATFITEEVARGRPRSPNAADADAADPPARILFVIEEPGPEADCQRISGFNSNPENKVPDKVIATLPLGQFPINDIAFSGMRLGGASPPDYIYFRRGDGNLPVYRIALSPRKFYCLDKDATAEATQSRFYPSLLASADLTEKEASVLSEDVVGVPSCSGKWADVK